DSMPASNLNALQNDSTEQRTPREPREGGRRERGDAEVAIAMIVAANAVSVKSAATILKA
ncbi:MAG: hypothetical protein HC765_04675, partial [Brachymonas sp.]|nr:hypothetical protein [Brachymonas sp.]